jgi:hypothetical protein
MPDWELTIEADVDINNPALTWRRPQTSAAKTDVLPWQALLDIQFNGQKDSAQLYQTLNLGYGASVPVTLEEVTPVQSGDGWKLQLKFYVYTASAATTYTTWFGIGT